MEIIEWVEPNPWRKWGSRFPDLTGTRLMCRNCESTLKIEGPSDVTEAWTRKDKSVYFGVLCPVCADETYLDLSQVAGHLPGIPMTLADPPLERVYATTDEEIRAWFRRNWLGFVVIFAVIAGLILQWAF